MPRATTGPRLGTPGTDSHTPRRTLRTREYFATLTCCGILLLEAVSAFATEVKREEPTLRSSTVVVPRRVRWSEVREALAQGIRLSERGHPVFGIQSGEAAVGVSADVLDAVDEAYSEAHPVILGLLAVPSSLTRVFSESSGGASAEIVRQNVLENSDFLRILVPRVDRLLADKGLVCEGGPSIPLLALRTVSWLDASRFLRGFISVPRVHTVDVEGQPLPIPRYSFKICTGGAGQELVRLDPSLGAAMFTTALESQAIIGDILDDARGRPAFLDLFTDEARTTFLGEEVSRRLEFDGRVLAHACEVLRQYREDLGIAVTECPVEASPPVPPQEHR